ncbi:hypothetical protein HN51_035661 [Arachis hypogaea]
MFFAPFGMSKYNLSSVLTGLWHLLTIYTFSSSVVPVIDMGTVQSVAVGDGTSTLNLELTMNVSAIGGQGENQTEEPNPQHDGLLLLAVKLLEKIDARTVALEERMSALERPMCQTGKSITEIQSILATHGGSPTAAATFSSTPAVYTASVDNLLAETNIPAQRQNRAPVTNDIGSLADTKKILEKGKGLAPSNVMSSLDIIIPNSPGFDDDVIIDESLSTPRPTKGRNNSGLPKRTLAQYWCSGVAKRTTTSGDTTHDSVDRVCEKIFRDLPSMSTLDSTTKVCEMFSMQETCRIPLKIPKLKKIDSNHMTGEEEMDSWKSATNEHNCNANVNGSSLGDGSAFKPYGRVNVMQSPVLLIPLGFQMVFRPTVHMDLTVEECKMAAYIYRKNDQYLEILFKFSTLEVPRAGFHSLSPVYMPNVDLMNIILMSASMRACQYLPPRVWYTPSVFAEDVLAMRPFDIITRKYMNRWMPATSRLEHVLVPVCEPTYTWYLMVVDVKHGRVYYLDVTRAPEHTERRERNMKTILLMLSQFFKLECNMLSFSHVSSDPTTWEPIKYPDGVLSYPECNNSCLWILNWIQTEGKFKVSNLPWQMDRLKLRMKTATKIVLLDCNETRATVVSKADAAWKKLVRIKE